MFRKKMSVCNWFAILMCCLLSSIEAADEPPFPKMDDLEKSFYQTEVEVSDLTQQLTALATEYYDGTSQRGRLEVLSLGERRSVFYYNETNEILEVNATFCQTWLTDESIYDYEPMFYGWLNKSPLRIGPTAPLWYAQDKLDKVTYVNRVKMRGIMCDEYALELKDERNDMKFYFFFAVEDWTTPYQYKGTRVPVLIEAMGTTSMYSTKPTDKIPVNIRTDFAYFRQSISDWSVFQPPLGIGCVLRKSTLTMPSIPNAYHYSAEFVDLLKAKKAADTEIEFHEVWYLASKKIARFDKFTRLRSTSELYDFNTGVTYSNVNGDTCIIKPLMDSIFESYEGKLMGHIKEPGEVLNLEGTFYSMGTRSIRGIHCDVFESARNDVMFKKKKVGRLVVTVYFSQEYLEINVHGDTRTRVPMYYMITGWNGTEKVVSEQYNVFGFDSVIWPKIHSTFRLGRCFPSVNDKSYFVMIINVPKEVAQIMEGQDDFIVKETLNMIVEHCSVSEMRIPLLRADYKSTGVYITGLMLDRPPALTQFWFEFEWDATTHDPDVKQIPTASNKEQCAYSCVDEDDFTCTGFFFCDNGCWLKSKDILEPDGDDPEKEVGKKCQEYLRAERDSNNKEEYLGDALLKLEEAVLNKKIKIKVVIDEALGTSKEVFVEDIAIGGGPNGGNDGEDGPYDLIIDFAKLDLEDSTVQELPAVDTLNDCYKSCKNSKSMDCSTFSYCPDGGDKRCRISSTLLATDADQDKISKGDTNCYIYSLKYLSFYDEYPGKVVLMGGDETFEKTFSAEICARKCRLSGKCRGFEYCKSEKTCVLHSKHILDLNPAEMTDKNKKCSHYSAKYVADFLDMGHLLVDDDSDKRVEITLQQCAKACSEERVKICRSFNYCPSPHPLGTESSCSLSTQMTTDKNVKTKTDDKCRHFEKRENIEDYGNVEKVPVRKPGYTKKGFTGLVVGMLFLGLFLGVIGFVAYSYFRSRQADSGMTVRFMKQET